MKKSIQFLLVFCSLALLQFSCSTTKLQIDTLRPAKVFVPHDQWKVTVLNRYNPQLTETDNEEVLELMSKGAYEAFLGAVDAVIDDSTYALVHTDTINYPAAALGKKLNMAQLNEINQQEPFHLLLALEHFDFHIEIETMESEIYGMISQTSFTNQIAKAHWTLYDHTGRILEQTSTTASEVLRAGYRSDSFSKGGPSISKFAPTINKLGWYTGYDYWLRVAPQPDNYVRIFYNKRNFKEATAYMKEGKWEEAISLLEPIARSDERDATKAAYNLAVAYEALSDYEQAKEWASKADEKNNQLASGLLLELEAVLEEE